MCMTPCFSDDQAVEEQGEGIELGGGPTYPWEGTDRDYKYEEVITFSAKYFSLVNMDLCALVIISKNVTIW